MKYIKKIQTMTSNLNKKWLFAHTRDENEYRQIMNAINTLARFTPVDWVGSVGERHAIEHNEQVEMPAGVGVGVVV